MKTFCEDCGCRKYDGACINCHEEIYIEQQYIDLNMAIPKSILDKANEHRKKIAITKGVADEN